MLPNANAASRGFANCMVRPPLAFFPHQDIARPSGCRLRVKMRRTQGEKSESAVPPMTRRFLAGARNFADGPRRDVRIVSSQRSPITDTCAFCNDRVLKLPSRAIDARTGDTATAFKSGDASVGMRVPPFPIL